MDPSIVDDSKYLFTTKNVYQNLSLDELAEHAKLTCNFIRQDSKALIVDSGDIKGRLPDDKYVVETKYAKKNVWWHEYGSDNKRLKRKDWKVIKQKLCDDISNKDIFVTDGFYNHDEKYRIAVRLITTQASAAYFFRLICIRPTVKELEGFKPQWVMMHSPETTIDNYQELGLNSPKVIATNLKQRQSIFIGTRYLAEINKVLLSIMSYYLSLNNIGIFYCSVSVDAESKSLMFLGLSGSGKTTLALDNHRALVTNEAIAWTESKGLYSLESGLTIKVASFKRDDSRIKNVLQNHLLIENPNFDEEGNVIFGHKESSQSNTYLTFCRENFENCIINTSDPSTIIFLVKDAKGVLPRVAKLSKGQAIYYFLSGYTSTSTGVEEGVVEPKPEFSSCYAQPFLLLQPTRYANILRQRLKHSNAKIYMINAGWIDGDFKTGRRVPVEETKAIVNYLVSSNQDVSFKYMRQKYFNFKSLVIIQDKDQTLHLTNNWKDQSEYKKQYKSLAKAFVKNYEQFGNDEFALKYKKFQPAV
ncbi:phosphoenolpyruvate carboxykinase (ATP) [Allofrancisella guangzhouensis]|uniref:Phosphoenolpyruvate carboxykinase (ATP) n=1 Tax=Allofrancisella guangzhouensis TaxID=594679 RepID=A0A0A8E5I8_9GAMM|nr:phosphoenolpyruvate carboxykinase (ATP) [Allofrancisella guangzhouensis]AJC49219.1 phosphoenolpyruvate carboxykinase [Allofrancisella guangzhouensis]MBK2027582.1 phosphoenolpyruvate carboxykinase (ATP) [Allofrancisella guangzhouensis]MBK2043873.1 phosphoenolpyruvate carboxykinase (ATP) [Allofrancisella guangzhouensis]MBK2045017.1 phosphoenolpyruvate carboxykinase (ATP) [Allofrancisella guangzhouensis]